MYEVSGASSHRIIIERLEYAGRPMSLLATWKVWHAHCDCVKLRLLRSEPSSGCQTVEQSTSQLPGHFFPTYRTLGRKRERNKSME
jgi:hypothetical protein